MHQKETLRGNTPTTWSKDLAAFDCSAFAALWAFQIGLCVGVGCEGISIIWAALFGASFPDYWAFRGDTRRGAVARVLYATQCAASDDGTTDDGTSPGRQPLVTGSM
jgi:hypothetical protein